MKNENKNIAIIGGGLGGISAALYLQKLGYNVTIFEANDKLGGRMNLIESDGFSFDTGPSLLNYPWILRELFQITGRKLENYVDLIQVDPSITFYWPDQTKFTISSDIYKLATEIDRLEPGSLPKLFKFLANSEFKFKTAFDRLITKNADNYLTWLKNINLFELIKLRIHSSFYKDLNKYFKSRYICEAFGSYSMYLGGSPFSLPGIFTILPYGELANGLFFPKGGMYSIVRGLTTLLNELGIPIHFNSPVKRIIFENKKVSGLESISGDILNFDIIISNVDVPTTYNKFLGYEKKGRYLKTFTKNMTPSAFTFYLGIKGNISNLAHHTIFLPRNYRQTFISLLEKKEMPDELPFYVCVPSETDSSLAPENHSTLFIMAPAPPINHITNDNYDELASDILIKIFNRMNDQRIEIKKDTIFFQKYMTPLDWEKKFNLYNGSAFGVSHTLFNVGPGRPKNYDQNIRGLYFVGASTTPGTGVPMVLLSGKMTAERIFSNV